VSEILTNALRWMIYVQNPQFLRVISCLLSVVQEWLSRDHCSKAVDDSSDRAVGALLVGEPECGVSPPICHPCILVRMALCKWLGNIVGSLLRLSGTLSIYHHPGTRGYIQSRLWPHSLATGCTRFNFSDWRPVIPG